MKSEKQTQGFGANSVIHLIATGVLLTGFWLLLSGVYKTLVLALGAFSIALTLFLVHRMDVADHESHPLHLSFAIPRYTLWLIVQIIKANIDVAKRILHPTLKISPTLVTLKAHQKTELGRVVYANSVTLTPGTITLRLLDNGDMVVHALSQEGAEDLQTGAMDQQVRRLGMDALTSDDRVKSDSPSSVTSAISGSQMEQTP